MGTENERKEGQQAVCRRRHTEEGVVELVEEISDVCARRLVRVSGGVANDGGDVVVVVVIIVVVVVAAVVAIVIVGVAVV